MIWEDLSKTWMLPGPWKVCCGHLTWSNCNCPGIDVSGTIDPSNQWIEFSPCWPIGGKLMLPPLFWMWPQVRWTDSLLHHSGHSLAILLVTLLLVQVILWVWLISHMWGWGQGSEFLLSQHCSNWRFEMLTGGQWHIVPSWGRPV